MKKITFLFVALCFITFAAIGQTTWYVSENGNDDTGDGTSENEWATITHALADVGVVDGDIIKIEGTITEDGDVTDGIIIQKSVTIKGEKFIYSTVQAHEDYDVADRRVFTIYPGYDVVFEHLIIKNGTASNYSGGILNYGNLTIEDCVIEDNTTEDMGAGIYQEGGSLSVNNCLIDGNQAANGGGGIYIYDCSANITNSTIANNSCTENLGNGAGILIQTDTEQNVLFENCTIINNVVNFNSYGGGIYLFANGGNLNTEIVNTTFTFNEGADGNGIYQEAMGGLTNDLTLRNCILDNGTDENYATTEAGTNNLTRTYTICRDATMSDTGTGNSNSTDPQLGIYGEHGGLTPTVPISETSPAKNTGTSIDAPEFDQRGSFRQGLHDIGSYEFTNSLAGIYTIDNTQPTNFPSGTNFISFEDAINALNAGGISDYVTFYVMPDQTFEEPPLLIYTTGTDDMPITFMTNTKGNSIIKGTGGIFAGDEPSSESDMILTLQEVNYITVSGIDFMDNETNTTPEEKMEMGIVLFDTEYVLIEDCNISLSTDGVRC